MYEPFVIGTRFRIVPPGVAPRADGRLDLVMARGAFGSGEHETTASCLEELAALPAVAGARVLDLGSGTGILGIAALLLGARQAVLVDVEPAAVAAARANAALNGLASAIEHVAGTLADCRGTGFDVALANLYGDVLLGVAAELCRRVRPGGWLLLSGILWEQAFDVRSRFEAAGCVLGRERWLDEYVTMRLARP